MGEWKDIESARKGEYMNAIRYPTGNKLLDDLTEFCGARLHSIFGKPPQCRVPSLAEDWWVEEALGIGAHFPIPGDREAGLRTCYRWARNRNVETGRVLVQSTEAAAWQLLHQASELIPTLFHATQSYERLDPKGESAVGAADAPTQSGQE